MKTNDDPQILPPARRGYNLEPLGPYEVALLVAGPSDGQRHYVKRGMDFINVVDPSPDLAEMLIEYDEPPIYRGASTYLRTNFSMTNGEKMGRFAIFLYEPLGRDAMIAIQHLILGYRNNNPINAAEIMSQMQGLPDVKRNPWE